MYSIIVLIQVELPLQISMSTSSFLGSVKELRLILKVKAEFAEVAITKKITSFSFQNEQIRSGTQKNINIKGHIKLLSDSLFTWKLLYESCGSKKKKDYITPSQHQQ